MSTAATLSGVRRLVRCTVGNEVYCLDNEWLDSIQVIENLYPSRGHDGAVGWIRRFDEKVPVFRLADQIYGSNTRVQSRQGVIMVLRKKERLWALLVDKVTAGGDVAIDHVYPLPALVGDSKGGQFPSVVLDDNGISLYLAPERLVPGSVSGVAAPAPAVVRSTPVSSVRSAIVGQGSAPKRVERVDGEGRAKATGQILTFNLVHEHPLAAPVRFAVSTGQAVEIVSELPMIQVPHSPPFVVGLANWRSLPIPVVDLAAWMGMTPAPYTSGCRLLVIRGTMSRGSGRDASILAIPAVDDIRKLDLPIEYKPWPTAVEWNTALALGIYRAERQMLIIPDLDAILSFQAVDSGYRM